MSVVVASSTQQVAAQPYQTERYKDAVEILLHSPVESCDNYSDAVVKQPGYHCLIAAADRAFQGHYPLALSPDMLWVTIMQGAANHINLNAETLRHKFVTHEGKADIVVRRDGFVRKSPENTWENVFPEFGERIREHIGEQTHKLILSDFSTTGPKERAASEVVLMDAMQSYFKSTVQTLCGIPYVSIEGTVEDWESIVARVRLIVNWGLSWWTEAILPLLDEFVSAAKGNANETFWRSIHKIEHGSGGPYINGWLARFIPYISYYHRGPSKNPLIANPNCLGISADDLPSSTSMVPFVWDYYGEKFDYQFVGGITAINQDADTRVVRPRIGWAVREVPNGVSSVN